MENYNPLKLSHDYMLLESGDVRLRAIKQACSMAQQANDTVNELKFHHDYIKESVFSGDRYRALIDFPQYLAALEKDQELKQELTWQTLWMFKWILEASYEFYQISKKQVFRWFAQFRSESVRSGHSLSAYYDKKSIFDRFCDPAKARLDYLNYLKCRNDTLSDGRASHLDTVVVNELLSGNVEKALDAAEKIKNEQLITEEVPAKTYSYFMEYYMASGDLDKASEYAALLKPYCINSRFRLEQTGLLMCLYSLTDISEGLEFFRKQDHLRKDLKNPYLCFVYDNGAARLFRVAHESGFDISGFLSGYSDFLSASDAYMKRCMDTAALFDARNDSTYFTDRCCFERRYGNV